MNMYVFTLACLCAGLLFDPNGFLRMSLAASFIHELGHVFAYIILLRKLPKLSFSLGGIALKDNFLVNRYMEIIIIACGPLANFITALILYLISQQKTSYLLLFFIAINVCIGIYNLLPIGVLDGYRLLALFADGCNVNILYILNKAFVIALSLALIIVALILNISLIYKVGFIISGVYILFCEMKK